MNYIIRAKYALKNNAEIVLNAEIQIDGTLISYIGKERGQMKEDYSYLEYPHGLVVPAFVNGHTHIPETLIRGICDDEDLHTWLYEHVWQVEPSMSSEQAKTGALLGIAEMIRSGTVAFIDQYFYSNQIAQAVAETGVKAFLAPSIFDGNPETKTIEKAFDQNKKVFDKWNAHDNRIFIGFGPHAPYSVSEEWFKRIIDEAKARGTKIHTHLGETMKEVNEAKETFKCTPFEFMNKLGGLDHIIAAHCIYTSDQDRILLKQHKTSVLSNPQSNMKIGAGIAPVPDYLQMGINVVLGTDGSASNNNLDILEEVRLLSLLHKGLSKDPKKLSVKELLPLFTSNGAKIFPTRSYTGVLAENNPADIVVVDMQSEHMVPVINPVSNWIFASNPTDIILTMANGKVLFEKKGNEEIFKTLNVIEVKNKAQHAIDDMMSKSNYKPKQFQ